MRADYALYVVAIILFIIAAYTATINTDTPLYISAIAVLGIIFIGLGYMARPKETTLTPTTPTPPPSLPELPPKQTPQPKTEPTTEEPKKAPKKKRARKRRTTRRRKKT